MPISSPKSLSTVSALTPPHPSFAPGEVQTGDVQLVIHSEPAPPPGVAGPRRRDYFKPDLWLRGIRAALRQVFAKPCFICQSASAPRATTSSLPSPTLQISVRRSGPISTDSNTFGSDRKSTRLNSSHITISYAVFCLKKKKKKQHNI